MPVNDFIKFLCSPITMRELDVNESQDPVHFWSRTILRSTRLLGFTRAPEKVQDCFPPHDCKKWAQCIVWACSGWLGLPLGHLPPGRSAAPLGYGSVAL